MQEEDRIERQIESRLEMASSCECGAYQIKGMEVYQVADSCYRDWVAFPTTVHGYI